MSVLLATTIKVSVVLLAAIGLSALLRRQSAEVRHWIVATGVACAMAMPLLILLRAGRPAAGRLRP